LTCLYYHDCITTADKFLIDNFQPKFTRKELGLLKEEIWPSEASGNFNRLEEISHNPAENNGMELDKVFSFVFLT